MNRFLSPNIVPTLCHLLNKNTCCLTEVLPGDMNYNSCRNVKTEEFQALKNEVFSSVQSLSRVRLFATP